MGYSASLLMRKDFKNNGVNLMNAHVVIQRISANMLINLMLLS